MLGLLLGWNQYFVKNIKYFVQGQNTVVPMGFKMQGVNPTILEQDTLSTVIHEIISNNYGKTCLK